ncbi:hypothetical protein FRB95_002285 [Tulasnella sp. JGI-2019a]|nr:hypothetical protein FRB95_002285 [Tulasnella sp. JGI-2019a]
MAVTYPVLSLVVTTGILTRPQRFNTLIKIFDKSTLLSSSRRQLRSCQASDQGSKRRSPSEDDASQQLCAHHPGGHPCKEYAPLYLPPDIMDAYMLANHLSIIATALPKTNLQSNYEFNSGYKKKLGDHQKHLNHHNDKHGRTSRHHINPFLI